MEKKLPNSEKILEPAVANDPIQEAYIVSVKIAELNARAQEARDKIKKDRHNNQQTCAEETKGE